MTDERDAAKWVRFRALDTERLSLSAHVLADGHALCGGWHNSTAIPTKMSLRPCKVCTRILEALPTPPQRGSLAAVLAALAAVHAPTENPYVVCCSAENGEQEWPCETVVAVRAALGDDSWPNNGAS